MNQLVGFTDGETTASYAYNAIGLRYEKTVDGETVHHVWDGNQQIIADVVESQFYEANCYIRGTNLAATYHYQNGAKSDYTYYVQNAHGDVVNLTDAEGAVTKTYHYDAFGVEQNIVDSDENAFRYCGEYFDAETGTIYLRARCYNPTTGRFISRDSYAGNAGNPLSLNLYTYCHNNPLFYFDPSGHSAWTDFWDEVVDCWKVGSSDFRDSWSVGIKSLSSGGKASQAFASYSQGVVDTFSSQAVSIVKTVRNPGAAAKNVASDYVSYGKNNPANWNPANYLGTKIGEGLVSQCQNSFNLIRNNGLNGAAYVFGQTTAVVAETGTSYLAAKMTVEKFATASTATGTVASPPTLDEIIKNPKVLSQSTPAEIYASLQQQNYTVKPLSRGSLKGIPFEEGGGYKVNFGGDGVFQYHSTGTHHGLDPYYKISTGATGTNRYDLWGNPIN